jgi:hypothetical protein
LKMTYAIFTNCVDFYGGWSVYAHDAGAIVVLHDTGSIVVFINILNISFSQWVM